MMSSPREQVEKEVNFIIDQIIIIRSIVRDDDKPDNGEEEFDYDDEFQLRQQLVDMITGESSL